MIRVTTAAVLIADGELGLHRAAEVMVNSVTFLTRLLQTVEISAGGEAKGISRDGSEVEVALLAIVFKRCMSHGEGPGTEMRWPPGAKDVDAISSRQRGSE